MTVNSQLVNPQDTSLQLQAAMKNMSTNAVFYFVIPLDVTILLSQGSTDVPSFASQWKSIDDSLDVSKVIKGTLKLFTLTDFVVYLN